MPIAISHSVNSQGQRLSCSARNLFEDPEDARHRGVSGRHCFDPWVGLAKEIRESVARLHLNKKIAAEFYGYFGCITPTNTVRDIVCEI